MRSVASAPVIEAWLTNRSPDALEKEEATALRAQTLGLEHTHIMSASTSGWQVLQLLRRMDVLRWFVCLYPALMCTHESVRKFMPFL